jgi:hypothetical protein
MDYNSNNSDNSNNSNYSSSSSKEKTDNHENSNENTEYIFIPKEKLEKDVKEKCGIPNWGKMIFGLFNENLRKKLFEKAKINMGFYNFILGVQQEYGIDSEINLKKALDYYHIAAGFKDTYALHKLYNVYCYENEKFETKRDREKEIFYLFQSIAYSDASFFINNDTFFKFDISYEITLISELENNFYQKFKNLFKNANHLENDQDELTFIESFICLKFLNDKHEVGYTKQLECVEKLKKLAEKKHLESCYKLAVVFRISKYF